MDVTTLVQALVVGVPAIIILVQIDQKQAKLKGATA